MEAEARRTARFDENGFTAGAVDAARLKELSRRIGADQWVPHILDLRRVQALL
jgi:uncharacterized protein (DUF2126 family)